MKDLKKGRFNETSLYNSLIKIKTELKLRLQALFLQSSL